ncbi:hypothetical protein K525DRAFT_254257 [Schizophyllum commune Loenen D]|nr:hypothetical protein K525DRAFT_254257 [Schizophyllum commune Loenen D]
MSTEILTSLCPGCQHCVSCTSYPFSPSREIDDAIESSDADNYYRSQAVDAELQEETIGVDRLPDEILEQIFCIACAGVVLMYPLSRLMLTVASISHVCRRWRAITEYDKQLWAPVCIKLDYYDIMALSEPLTSEQLLPFKNAVRAYLAKSDPLPFAIDLQGPCLALDFHGQRKLCILSEGDFFDHLARRCHRARLCTTSINHVNYLFRVARRSLSARVEMESLESLELVENRKHPNEMYLHKADFFTRNAPRLRSWKQHVVDLTSAGHRGAIVHAPGRTLECLEASWTEWRLAGAALPRWVNLKGLVIAICQPYDPWRDFNLKPVTLSQLESLTVAATPARTVIGRLLGALTAPRLRQARFRCATPEEECRINKNLTPDRTEFPHAELAGFLERSKCALGLLVMRGVCATPEDAILIRERLPETKELLVEELEIA